MGERRVVSIHDKTVSRRWRSSLRFSLRGLIILVLLIGGWLGWIVHRARLQRTTVLAVEKSGGGVLYDWQYKNGRYASGGSSWWPKWLLDRLGVDYFHDVTWVLHLERMPSLTFLYLAETGVTDAGLEHLKEMNSLKTLWLGGAKVTDSGVQELQRSLPTVTILR
jgi:hypothetical protein